MKIIETLWFSGPQGCMGIVLGVNEEGERKAYIGTATGSHEQLDAELIAQVGAPVMPKALWRVRKGKQYFRRKYKAMIAKLAREGKLEEFRAFHRLTSKDWRSKIALEALERHRADSIRSLPPIV